MSKVKCSKRKYAREAEKKERKRSGLWSGPNLACFDFEGSFYCVLIVWVLGTATQVWSQHDESTYLNAIKKQIEHVQLELQERPGDPQLLTTLAGLHLNLGSVKQYGTEQRIAFHEQGVQLAKQALTIQETLADAHFYYAANLGSATQLKGIMASAFVVQDLKLHARRAVELQHDHTQALHMLGRMFDELPWFLGGDKDLALKYLKRAVFSNEHDVHARLDLAKLYIKRRDVSAARRELEKIVHQVSLGQDWKWKHYYQPEAAELLRELQTQEGSDQE